MKRVSPSSISGLHNKIKMKKKSGEKLKNTLKNVLRYLRSDSHMYSSMLSDKPSSVSSSQLQVNKGGMATKRTKRGKNKTNFLHKLVDYLKADCYLYAPLLDGSSSMQETMAAAPESNRASKITRPSKRAAKRPNGKKSSPRSTLVKNTLAFRREEKCLINQVGRPPSSSEISNPEGIPLTMKDMKGNEWMFHFRFWPNNNSRMYVLEGVTPCIQSMQLVAGDTVTFSRLEPEGTLVMGGRKSSTPPGKQSKESINTGNRLSTRREVTTRASRPGETFSAPIHVEDNMISSSLLTTSQANSADPENKWTEAENFKNATNDVLGGEIFPSKRKNGTLVSNSKCPRMGNSQIIELEITLKDVQGLLRPPSDYAPQIVIIDGNEIAEFEEPPVIGRPTILATDCMGGKFQWAQCEDCCKWRRIPSDILLPSRWTCYKNTWDPERSLCSVAEELIPEELEGLLITAKKLKFKNQDEPDSVDALEGLNELANLAIHEKGGIQTTTRHPRHRPGCTCVVCIQSPSGKGPKHKQTCTCNACVTMKRRFQTIMSKHEMKQTEDKRQKLQQPEDILLCSDNGNCSSSHEAVTNDGSGHDLYKKKYFESPFKGQIDLNVQPEGEEWHDEVAPKCY